MTYDEADRRTATALPNKLTANNTFDVASDLTQIAYLSGGSYSGGVCSPGTATGTGTGTLTYGFDQAGRQVARGGSFYTQVNPPAVAASSVSFNADNQLTTWNTLNNIYDGNGNLNCTGSTSTSSCTGAHSQSFTWDARNRMTHAGAGYGLGGHMEYYVYDGLNRRQTVGVAATGVVQTFLYDGLNPVQIATTTSGSATDANSIFEGLGLDERFGYSDSATNTQNSIVTDVQGSTVDLQTTSLATTVSYTYPPFGSTGTPSVSFSNPFRYTGREASDNTGLYYYRTRYYNPAWSRFVAEDPLGMAAGPNAYRYADNDPLVLSDPLGECPLCIVAGVGAFIGGSSAVTAAWTHHESWGQIALAGLGGSALGAVAAVAPPFLAGEVGLSGTTALAFDVAGNSASGFFGGLLGGDRGGDLLTDMLFGGVAPLSGEALIAAYGVELGPWAQSLINLDTGGLNLLLTNISAK